MLTVYILEILWNYSDENHRIAMTDIAKHLEIDYSMKVDRKTIRRTLFDLIEIYEYPIGKEIKERISPKMDPRTNQPIINPKTGEPETVDNSIWCNLYYEHDFTDHELRLLIDGLLFSKYIPYSGCKELVEKLERLTSKHFHSRVAHIARLPENRTDNKQLFWNIDLLDEAISKNRKISFKYLAYDTDKKMHPKKRENGTDRIYVCTPYQMVAQEGKYYLICNYDKYDDISNYRVDRIADLEIIDEKGKPFEALKWSNGQRLDLVTYMKEHPYMYSSDNVHVKFRINPEMISDIIDIFGTDVRFMDKDETGVTVFTTTNEEAMRQFAQNFAPDVVVLEPKRLRDRIRENLKRAVEVYDEQK